VIEKTLTLHIKCKRFGIFSGQSTCPRQPGRMRNVNARHLADGRVSQATCNNPGKCVTRGAMFMDLFLARSEA